MKLSVRSYPHPVVGNRDDVPGAAFQAALEMTTDKESVFLDAEIACSSVTVNQLVNDGAACFVMHVECSNTLYRRAFDFTSVSHRISIPRDHINDSVEVNVFVLATRNISNYRVSEAHSDYQGVTFDVEAGDRLAIGETRIFDIETEFDSLSRVGSIMQIREADEEGDLPMRVDYSGDKIVVVLAKRDFTDYKLLRANEGISGPLTTTIVLPVLIEALHILKEDEEEEPPCRWMRILLRRKAELPNQSDILEIAQVLLELPVRRSLNAARMLVE